MSTMSTTRQRYFNCEENTRTKFRREKGEQNRDRHSDKYERDGPLSPLRSPLRVERNAAVSPKSRRDLRATLDRKHNRSRGSDRAKPWQTVLPDEDKFINSTDFPSLETAKLSKFTPEQKPGESKILLESTTPLDWSSQMEAHDRNMAQRNRGSSYKRKLVMADDSGERLDENRPNRKVRTPAEREEDRQVIARREKQIGYGKITAGYQKYTQEIPKHKRSKQHPFTPSKVQKCSRRSWDMQVKIWRRQLHVWDPRDVNSQGLGCEDVSETASDCGSTSTTAEVAPIVDVSSSASASSQEVDVDDVDLTTDLMTSALVVEPKVEVKSDLDESDIDNMMDFLTELS